MHKEENKEFAIRSYTKAELARKYFPEARSTSVATHHLMRWINRCPELMEQLHGLHYVTTQRLFSPLEVKLIIQYLGEP